MATEIERKFLVRKDLLPKELPPGDELEQGYLSTDPTVRVRLVATPDGTRHAELTIKGKGMLSRAEFNYPIPPADAEALLRLCGRSLRKVRRKLGRWDLDHFRTRDLWLAEIELKERIRSDVSEGMEKTQREFLLRQQLACRRRVANTRHVYE